jgi:hypothetical protein
MNPEQLPYDLRAYNGGFWHWTSPENMWSFEAQELDKNCTVALKGSHNYINFIYSAMAIPSILGSVLVALTIFYNKKLKVHPSPLIAYICICEAISCYNGLVWAVSSPYVICYFDLLYIFEATVKFYVPSVEPHDTYELLCLTNEVMFQYFQLASLFLNLCLCIDLILTL